MMKPVTISELKKLCEIEVKKRKWKQSNNDFR